MHLNKLNGKNIKIIGHDNLDVDSVISCLLMERLLMFKKIDAKFVVFDKNVDEDTLDVLGKLGIDISQRVASFNEDEDKLFLIDHNETNRHGIVVGCIDHHPVINPKRYDIYFNEPSSSTAIHVYKIMCDNGYIFNECEIRMIIAATYVDTCSLKSEKTLKKDIVLMSKLSCEWSIDLNEYYIMGLMINDIKNDSIDRLAFYGEKKYCYDGRNVKSSYVQVLLYDDFLERENEILEYILEDVKSNKKLYMRVFLVVCLESEVTVEYRIYKNSVDKIEYNKILSRGKNVMPNIEKMIVNKEL